MRSRQLFAFFFVALLSSPYLLRAVPLPQSTTATKPPAAQASTLTSPIQTQTRAVMIDVVVTDSHGNPVRGLKQDDFQVFDGRSGPQKIARFEFIDHSANAAANPLAPPAATVFTNQSLAQLTVPPTILLMDSLNTEIADQAATRRHMLAILKTLPPNTPVAVFSLGHTLHILQGFSTDTKALQAALDKTLRSVPIDQNPQTDPDAASAAALDQNGGQENDVTQALEDFESMQYEQQMAIRVGETSQAMVEIAQYLKGYPGRKNLIWFSESFPIWLEPTTNFGTHPFAGSATFGPNVNAAAEALTDAQVAVYPVDARQLEVQQLYSATQNPRMNRQSPGAGYATQLNLEDQAREAAQATMDQIAQSTGGRTCKNTNDLSGCVESALHDSEAYYELSYYPEGVKWDGSFHKIDVKTPQHGLKMAYRRGYYATDVAASLRSQKPEDLLRRACSNPLPSTEIPVSVEPVAPGGGAGQTPQVRYLFTISPKALTLPSEGGSRQMSVQVAICEYDRKGGTFQYLGRDLSRSVPESVYQEWVQQQGIKDIFNFNAKPEDTQLRFAVLDVPTGATGSVDFPAHPREFASLPNASRDVVTSLLFKSSSGKSGKLDWKEGTITYQGDLSVKLGASAFFQKMYGGEFHCQGGNLVPNDPGSNAAPKLQLLLESSKGAAAIVDFSGNETMYAGSLAPDPTAKAFFDQFHKLCHCQQP